MDDPILLTVEIITVAALGLIYGSFATAITHREAKGESWYLMNPKKEGNWSQCPDCHHRLHAIDLIPVLSWLLQKGRCRYCSASISSRYPLTELICLVGALALYAVYGLTLQSVVLITLLPFSVALLWIDLDQMILPNRLVAILMALASIYTLLVYMGSGYYWPSIQSNVLGVVVYPAVFGGLAWTLTRVLKKEALGIGDIKFLAPAGLLAGIGALPAYLILSGLYGVLTALATQKIQKKMEFPFGPALILALFTVLLAKDFTYM